MKNPEMKLRPKKSVCHNIEKIKSIRNKQKYTATYKTLLGGIKRDLNM